jgi:hypothetical protein
MKPQQLVIRVQIGLLVFTDLHLLFEKEWWSYVSIPANSVNQPVVLTKLVMKFMRPEAVLMHYLVDTLSSALSISWHFSFYPGSTSCQNLNFCVIG